MEWTDNSNNSEHWFRETLDKMMEGIQIHDFDWKYIYVNEALLKYSQYPREELIGFTVMEKYPGIEQTPLFATMERCMKARTHENLTTEFVFPNGDKAYFQLSIQPVPQGIFILSIDITERKKAEEKIVKLNEELEQKVAERTAELNTHIRQLKESEEKFQKVFQSNSAGIAITHLPTSRYLDVNDAFIELVGYSKEELVGRTSVEMGIVVNVERREEVLKFLNEHGYASNFEITIRHKSGKLLDVLSSAENIWLNGERYAINIIFDITERKHAEEQLKAVNKELEAFTYSVSHDLRAPLRAINGYGHIIKEEYKDVLDAEGKRLLERIADNAVRMGKLIDNLLDFSRLGRTEVRKNPTNMNELVAQVISETDKTYHKAAIIVHPLPDAMVDKDLMYHVVYNLLSNAIKYSSKKENPRIEISAHSTGSSLVFSVSDNGSGFDMRYVSKLFGVFQRLHDNSEFEGTGVGLAIVQRIIFRHGGKVWAEGKEGEGATFFFELPGVR